MSENRLKLLIDRSGSMLEMGKKALALQVKEDLAEFFELDEIKSEKDFGSDAALWITDGYEYLKSDRIYTLLIGCDKPLHDTKDSRIFILEEFPLLIEKLMSRSEIDE